MPASSTPDSAEWLIAGEPAALERASVLVDAHRAVRPVRVLEFRGGLPADGWWSGQLEGVRAVVLVADPRLPLSEVVTGTHLRDGDVAVPVGVLPDDAAAVRALSMVQSRSTRRLGPGPAVVLGSREERATELATWLVAELVASKRLSARQFTAQRLSRTDLLDALALGPGLAMYVGQGHALGWGGYGGIQAWQLDTAGAQPVGAILSLTCFAATRAGNSPSFSEDVVRRGLAGAAFGAAGLVTHAAAAALAAAIATRIRSGANTLADALPADTSQLEGYRIAGDPLAPFIGARGSRRGVSEVFAPAVGDPLPPVEWSTPALDQ